MPPVLNRPDEANGNRELESTPARPCRTFAVRTLLAATTLLAVLAAVWMTLRPKKNVEAFLDVQISGYTTMPPMHSRSEVRDHREKQIELLHSDLVLGDALKRPGIADLGSVRGMTDPVGWLRANLQTDYVNNSGLLRVRLTSSNPDEAVKLVNAVVDAYFEDFVNEEVQKRIRHRDSLQQVSEQRWLAARPSLLRYMELKSLKAKNPDGKTGDQIAEQDAEFARLKVLVDKAKEQAVADADQMEIAKKAAREPARVTKVTEARISKD